MKPAALSARGPSAIDRFLILMAMAMLLVILALGIGVALKADKAAANAADTSTVVTGPQQPAPGGSLFDLPHLRLYGEIVTVIGALRSGRAGPVHACPGSGLEPRSNNCVHFP